MKLIPAFDCFPNNHALTIEFDFDDEVWKINQHKVHLAALVDGVRITSRESSELKVVTKNVLNQEVHLITKAEETTLAFIKLYEYENQCVHLPEFHIYRTDPISRFIYVEK